MGNGHITIDASHCSEADNNQHTESSIGHGGKNKCYKERQAGQVAEAREGLPDKVTFQQKWRREGVGHVGTWDWALQVKDTELCKESRVDETRRLREGAPEK